MNLSKLITLAAILTLISTPLFFASTDAEAATTGKSSKSSKSKSKSSSKSRTHRLTKKSKRSKSGKTSSKRSKKKSSRNKTVTRTTTTRSNGRTTVSRTTRAQHGSNVRRRTVVRHNTGHHVGSTRTRTTSRRTVVHRAPRTRTVVHHHRAPRHRTVVHHRAARRTVVHHHENHVEQRGVREQKCSPIDFYVNGGLGVNTLHISDVSAGALSGTNYRVAVGGKGELFGIELGMDGGSFLFDDGTSLSVVGANVDFKAQPSFGMLEPYGFIGVGGYALQDNVFQEDAGSAALRAGFGADVRVNNVGIGAKYTWAGYNFQNDQSYVNVGATTQTLSGNLSFYF